MGEPGKRAADRRNAQSQDCLFYLTTGAMGRIISGATENICWQLIECCVFEKPAVLPPSAT